MNTGTFDKTDNKKEKQIVRMRFCRSEPAIWLSHLDMMRTLERAVRRAGLPVAYSQGFNPRPQLTFALPLGVGLATQDDYLDLYLEQALAEEDIVTVLNDCLPSGIKILRTAVITGEEKSLMSLITAAEYEIEARGADSALLRLKELPEAEPWEIVKESKKGSRMIDIKPLLLNSSISGPDKIRVLVRAGSRDNLRPDLLLNFLNQKCGLEKLAVLDAAITRTRLLIDKGGQLQSPLP